MDSQISQNFRSSNFYQKELLKIQLRIQQQAIDHISEEIHSNIGQILSLVRLNLSVLSSMGQQPANIKINHSKELLDEAIEDLRRLSTRLDVSFVRNYPLNTSLLSQLTYAEKNSLYATSFKTHGEELAFDTDHKLVIFHIVQEVLYHATKNANTSAIKLTANHANKRFQLSIVLDLQDIPRIESVCSENMFKHARMIGAGLSVDQTNEAEISVLLEYPNIKQIYK